MSRSRPQEPLKQAQFTKEVCLSFRVSKSFAKEKEPDTIITSMDYDDAGRYLVTTSVDDTISLYDSVTGRSAGVTNSKKYGCHLTRFTHKDRCCVFSTTKGPDSRIGHLDITKGAFLRYYTGHDAQVTSIEMNPRHDTFVSAAMDDTVKMWDLRASNAQATVPSAAETHVSMDPSGQVLCISSVREGTAAFYVLKTMTQFDRTVKLPDGFLWNKVEFSNDNKFILFSSVNGDHILLDAFEFTLVARLCGVTVIPSSGFPHTGSASFTPDGKYVFSGNGNGNVLLWSLKKEDYENNELPHDIHPLAPLEDDVTPRMLLFNPKHMQFTTADTQVKMWLPTAGF
ncbi:CYFA0S04e05072g1_1 [Cyberlindnera fabianii]|uniref:CYFA0S04e05072g1_1 n=1 Tax=Cyberlindnera fabianii TaxID=36022 RepID=A0A061ARI4_CYBFA|nr:CYFA0S04e05072g1_1 [Cyberlindnera fabianii]